LGGLIGDPLDPVVLGPVQNGVSLTLECRLAEAATVLEEMPVSARSSANGLLASILNTRARGLSADAPMSLASLRWPLLRLMASMEVPGRSPLVDGDEDLRLYGRFSVAAPEVGPVFPTAISGMSAWLTDPGAAAERGAPGSGLAGCQ
jgi:hypothetical protein